MKYLKPIGVIFFGLVILGIYSYRLNFLSDPYFDESLYVKFYHSFIYDHRYLFISVHPLLWGLLTWPFLALFGQSMAVWRAVSLIAGLLSIILVYALTKRVLKDTLSALFAVFFFAFDCISLTQARVAMMNSLCLLLMVLSLYIFLKYWTDQKGSSRLTLLATGICLGLALSTKLAAISMILMISFLYIQKIIQDKNDKVKLILSGMLFFLVLPMAIYFAVYTWIFSIPGCSWKDIWALQVFNLHYNLVVNATQPQAYSSLWWGWPLLLRPNWFYFAHHNGIVNGVICIGNPVYFWMIPVMFVCLCLDWVRQRRPAGLGIILFGFLTQWLFYADAPRTTFFHYFYFSMPFVAMGMAWVCAQLWRLGRSGQCLVSIYMILVFGSFIYWYPLLTGLTISDPYYQSHIWLRSWI